MTRYRDIYLEDLRGCTHKAEIPITEEGQIVQWRCRCGKRIETAILPVAPADGAENAT